METNHNIETRDGEFSVTVEWQTEDCECTSAYGDGYVTETWPEFHPVLVTHESGETFDMENEDPTRDWEAQFMAQYLEGAIQS